MKNYAKLINGQPEWAPNPVKINGYTVSNPQPVILRQLGYKEVIYPESADPSTDAKSVVEAPAPMIPIYTEEDDCIRVSYVEAEPEPQPDPEQLREMAYRAEADQYLMAYEGYIAEGKISESDEQKALDLSKKAEIRERFPDKINELEARAV